MDLGHEIESCLARIALGEQSAFDQLYSITAAPLYAMCASITADDTTAARALEDAYSTIWSEPDGFRAQGLGAAAWVVSVARDGAVATLPGQQEQSTQDAHLEAVLSTPGKTPPDTLKPALDRRLFGKLSAGRTLLRWALGAIIGAAAAGAVAFVSVFYVIPSMTQTVLEARLEGDGGVAFTARYESSNGSLSVARVEGAGAVGLSRQLWLAVPGQAPFALGNFDAQGRLVADLSAAPSGALAGAVLLVSEEAPGGSEPGAEPSEVLAAGHLAAR
ncbi:MAG: hypothetical protein MK180_00235 [Rhodobacteraceae bacterium]|nr:hypothetical protein [Paracoccaceae bacterium]